MIFDTTGLVLLATVAVLGSLIWLLGALDSVTQRLKGNPPALQRLREYEFPSIVRAVFARENPSLTQEQRDLAFDGLRQFFELMLMRKGPDRDKPLGMPSALVDSAWHAFILCTREYEQFCKDHFGHLIHHSPDPESAPGHMNGTQRLSPDVARTWRVAQQRMKAAIPKAQAAAAAAGALSLIPAATGSTPFLFALDGFAGFEGGWTWDDAALQQITVAASLPEQTPFATGEPSAGSSGSACAASCGGGCGGG